MLIKFTEENEFLKDSCHLKVTNDIGDSETILIDKPKMNIGFNKIVSKTLNTLDTVVTNISRYEIEKRGIVYDAIRIDRNFETEFLFSFFDVIGVNISTITLAKAEKAKNKEFKLHLDSNLYNLIKDKEMDDDTLLQLTMYMHSLHHLFNFVAKDISIYNKLIELMNVLSEDKIEVLKNFKDGLFYSYDKIQRIELTDLYGIHNGFKFIHKYAPLSKNSIESDYIVKSSLLNYVEAETDNDKIQLGIFKVNTLPDTVGYYTYTKEDNSLTMYFNKIDDGLIKRLTSSSVIDNKIIDKGCLKLVNLADEIEAEKVMEKYQINDVYKSDFFEGLGKPMETIDGVNIKMPSNMEYSKEYLEDVKGIDPDTHFKDDPRAKEYYIKSKELLESKNITLNSDLKPIKKLFKKGIIYSMYFTGASGTGKTSQARALAVKAGFAPISINMATNTEESDLIGLMIPNPNKEKASDPEFIWKDGIVTQAVRKGYCIILEELNMTRPGVLAKLNNLLDDIRQLDLPNGELVYAHPNFRCLATSNIAYEGTQRMNKAFLNRFNIVKRFDKFAEPELIKIIKQNGNYSDEKIIKKIIQVYNALDKYIKENRIDAVLSIRQLINVFKQRKAYKNVKENLISSLVNPVLIENNEWREEFIESVLSSMELDYNL